MSCCISYRKFYILLRGLFLLLVLLGLFSCSTMKKTKSHIRTETITRIDTVIVYKPDTIPVIKTVLLHDTAVIENKEAVARSYYSVTKNKIVLELKMKSFDIPLRATKTVTTNQDKKIVERKNPNKIFFIIGLILIAVIIIEKIIPKKT
jgi:hypothetical protein